MPLLNNRENNDDFTSLYKCIICHKYFKAYTLYLQNDNHLKEEFNYLVLSFAKKNCRIIQRRIKYLKRELLNLEWSLYLAKTNIFQEIL